MKSGWQSSGIVSAKNIQWGRPLTRSMGKTHQTSSTGRPTALLNLIAVAADLNKYNTKPLCFCDQTLQELRPAACISTHGRINAPNVFIAVCPPIANVEQIHVEVSVRFSKNVDVGEIVVEQLGHASDCALDDDVAIE